GGRGAGCPALAQTHGRSHRHLARRQGRVGAARGDRAGRREERRPAEVAGEKRSCLLMRFSRLKPQFPGIKRSPRSTVVNGRPTGARAEKKPLKKLRTIGGLGGSKMNSPCWLSRAVTLPLLIAGSVILGPQHSLADELKERAVLDLDRKSPVLSLAFHPDG